MKNKTQKGYALLITMIIISIILLIATGLSNSTTKQLILSSSAKDSQTAFYQADIASECALYADYKGAIFEKDPETGLPTGLKNTFPCGVDIDGVSIINMNVEKTSTGYKINPPKETSNEPCFRIEVVKGIDSLSATTTTITAKGYNICNTSNLRTVERTIQVSY